jgi:hypothetical protein
MLLKIVEGRTWQKFVLCEGLLYRANKLCVPANFVRLLLLQEMHGGDLRGLFGVKKTEDVLSTHFYWPRMHRDVERYVSRCTTCNKAKSQLKPHGLYMPLHVPSAPWEHISMDFVLGFPSVTPQNPQTPRDATRLHDQQPNTKQNKIWQRLLCNYKHRRSKRDILIQNESY